MKNDNDLILERLRGVPAHKSSWRDKFESENPNAIETNDNTKSAPLLKTLQNNAEALPPVRPQRGGADTPLSTPKESGNG